jgi:tRNA A-37 threonylcarbamoyl transferase component Bud32
MFTKKFHDALPEDIKHEAQLQKRAAKLGISPGVHRVTKTTIVMENMNEMCIADKYGEQLRMIPKWIREEIVEILWTLYNELGIQYVDVTPYNFIEKDGRVWVIDFGHAKRNPDSLDPYLERMFNTWKLTRWNPRFK